MALHKIAEYLETQDVTYTISDHSPAFNALEIAYNAEISGYKLSKTVVIYIDGAMAMLIIPAAAKVELGKVRKELQTTAVRLANELEFETRFPYWELGSIPPFGNLAAMPVYVSLSIADQPDICFSAGNHFQLINMPYHVYQNLVHPHVLITV